MKDICHTCGKTVYVPPREKKKNEHYDEYDKLLTRAMDAGMKAIDYTYVFNDVIPDRGVVMVSLDDGTTSFARFLRQRHPGMFNRPSLHKPPCYLVEIEGKGFRDAVNYAIAFRDVLAEGGISVTIVSRPIDREN